MLHSRQKPHKYCPSGQRNAALGLLFLCLKMALGSYLAGPFPTGYDTSFYKGHVAERDK